MSYDNYDNIVLLITIMIFEITLSSPKPVYQQIIDQVKYAVATGSLKPGDRLPPIRDVAEQTRINRNTIAKAYSELEREGIIYTRPGQGSFIVEKEKRPELQWREKREIISEMINELLVKAKLLNVKQEQLLKIFEQKMREFFTDAQSDISEKDRGKSECVL